MGPCEVSAELGCTSPRMFVGDRNEGVVDNAVSEGFVEREMEPLSSLHISLPITDRGKQDFFSRSGNGVVGIEDGSTTHVPLRCAENTEVSNKTADFEFADRSGEVLRDGLGERLDETDRMDHSSSLVEARDRIAGDFTRGTHDTDFEVIVERHDIKCGPSNNDPESGSGSSIRCGLNRICLDEGLCESGMNSCLTNFIVEGEVSSGIKEVAAGLSDSAALCLVDANSGCDKLISQNLVEAVCVGTMDNESSKILVTQDTSKLSGCIAVPNLTYVAEVVNQAANTGNDNGAIDGDLCEMKCPDTYSLPLRRSSRSRKTVQQVQSRNGSTRYTKKASKDSLHRTTDLLLEATRKKRSSHSRSMCSSGWGMFENLSKYFRLSNEVVDQGTRKKKASGRRGKKSKVVDKSASSEVQQEVPCRPIRLKVTFGKKDKSGKGKGISLTVVDFPSFQQGNDDKPRSCCSNVECSAGNVMDSSVPKEIPRLLQCSNSTSNVQLAASNLEICSVPGKTNHDDPSQLDFEKPDGSCTDKFPDPGTSPDSEVIDQLIDSTIGPKAVTSSRDLANKASHSKTGPMSHCGTKKSKNKRNKKDKLSQTGILALECQHGADSVKMSSPGGEDFCSSDNVNAEFENLPSNTAGSELVSMVLLPVSVEGSNRIPSLDNVIENNNYSRMIAGREAGSGNSCELLTPAETQGKKNSKGSKTKGKSRNNFKGSKTKGKSRNKSKSTDEVRLQNHPSSQQKGKKKLSNKQKLKETDIFCDSYKIRAQPGTALAGNLETVDVRRTELSKEGAVENASCLNLTPNGIGEQSLVPRVAWVCCDDCLKWRSIPAVLADVIDSTNCRWTCKDNQDQAFADCSISQEKSNAEINAELQISDEEDARDEHLGSKGSGLKQVVASQSSTWMLIKSNLFLHRSRKTQTMDEIMVCHCKPPVGGSLGCGSHCLNRMLNIECVQGTCPCGDLCSNQQFQRRQYAELSWFRCGKKGYGLQVLEDISEGQFLIEYVGEVLDLQAYDTRQKDYASKGHKHFYFMTLNGNEVIDASAKGNLGRFVNHSCDPNCRTEKWVVNGEICVGLFALRSIKKGEELTFDYNYVRVFGAAAKKCHCGSFKCRGYIGGDTLNAEIIIQGDSDEEFPEPIVVNENGEIDHSLGDMMAKSCSQDIERVVNGKKLSEERSEIIVETAEIISKIESSIDDSGPVQTVPGKDSIGEVRESTDSSTDSHSKNLRSEPISSVKIHTSGTEHTTGTPTSSPKSDILHVENKSVSGLIDSSGRVSEVEIECEPHTRPHPRMKMSHPSKSVRNKKSSCNSANVGKVLSTTQRPKILSCKPKKLLEGSASGHREDVEKNLNELLDAEGGICKKKDASKGYLKLLLLTAASGDSGNGGAIQSNRILSMILDAMLKTKSRGVLQDVINKNGLQMLHNMMKLYRRDFKKIPILRKLLKVLEFLAEKEILTAERINVDSLHPGVESFRESILFFTEHDDNQVHQIARSFRDRWIPHARRFIRWENSDRRRDFRRVSNSNGHFGSCHQWREQEVMAVETRDQSRSMSNLTDVRSQEASSPQLVNGQTVNRPRKRKSRWDQPASPKKNGKSPKVENSGGSKIVACKIKEEENNCCGAQNISRHRGEDMMHTSDDDAPPGFSCLHDSTNSSPPGFPLGSCPVSSGLLQTRFNPNLPVAYGIPFSVVQKFGTPQSGTADSWVIGPAIPFLPFPPLPPYPRDKGPMRDQEEARQDYHTHEGDQDLPSTSGANQNTAGSNHKMHHERDPRNFSGKRYYRQKNWVSPKRRPPWARNIDGWGYKGNYPPHPRNGSFEMFTGEEELM